MIQEALDSRGANPTSRRPAHDTGMQKSRDWIEDIVDPRPRLIEPGPMPTGRYWAGFPFGLSHLLPRSIVMDLDQEAAPRTRSEFVIASPILRIVSCIA